VAEIVVHTVQYTVPVVVQSNTSRAHYYNIHYCRRKYVQYWYSPTPQTSIKPFFYNTPNNTISPKPNSTYYFNTKERWNIHILPGINPDTIPKT
jgi:hypothetical protein